MCSDIPVSDSAVRSDIPMLNTVRCVMLPGGRLNGTLFKKERKDTVARVRARARAHGVQF